MKRQDDLNVLLPATELMLGKLELRVQPFPFVKLPEVLAIVKNIGQEVYEILNDAPPESTAKSTGKGSGKISASVGTPVISKVADLIMQHFDEVIALMAIYCRVDREVFLDEASEFSIEDGVLLLLTIWGVHKHFFIQRIAPMLRPVKSQ